MHIFFGLIATGMTDLFSTVLSTLDLDISKRNELLTNIIEELER
ncbi:MAG: hypothetical protein AAFQ37_04260 [Bacteroidota bacterium]